MVKHSLALLIAILIASVAPAAWADSPPDYVSEWGGFSCCGLSADNGLFYSPGAVAVAPSGTVYVADSINDRVEYFTADGVYLGKWGGLSTPYGIAVALDGTIYVADSGNNRIVHFSSTGTQLNTWGTSGTGNGEFDFPWGLAIDNFGDVYVADNGNDRIQRFDSDGTYNDQFGGTGSDPGDLDCPTGLVWSPLGGIYVVDACNSRIQRFSEGGAFQLAWGSFGSGNSQFTLPQGIAVDLNGAIYVTDGQLGRVQKFNRTGAYLSEWNQTSSGNFLDRPSAVAVGSGAGFSIYVTDADDHVVYRYAYPATGVPGDGGDIATPSLVRVFPNPAAGRAQVSFRVESANGEAAGAWVRADIFDIAGRSVGVLHDGFLLEGERTLAWNGLDQAGQRPGAGMYFVRVTQDGRPTGTARFVLTR